MRHPIVAAFAFLALILPNLPASAAISLPYVFSDNMVLQRKMADPIWGTAAAGARVVVRFAGQEKSVTADSAGQWSVKLDPLPANAQGQSLVISDGVDTITFKNVLVGEVWLCSGQSNMEKPIGDQPGQSPTVNAQAEIARANHPLIRLLTAPKGQTTGGIKTPWEVCSPATIAGEHFSAAAYFFGRKIQKEINVPVGLIHSSWGGTQIEPWTNAEGFASVPSLKDFPAHWAASAMSALPPTALYTLMIKPLVPFGIRGAIWYQGESNVSSHDRGIYFDKMQALIGGWRQVWGEGDFPFYFVQLAPFAYSTQFKSAPDDLPEVWQAQLKSLSIPHTGMVVTTDLADDLHNIHPIRKREVGERLALWALAKNYGKTNLVFSGPLFQSLEIKGNRAVVHFDYAQGLKTSDGKTPIDFEIAGADGNFAPADAMIEGNTIVLKAASVEVPSAVRFGWNEAAHPNLVNGAGLPASPFASDK